MNVTSARRLQKKRKFSSESTFSQQLADVMADKVGSWSFVIAQTIVLIVWIAINILPGSPHWDPAPFILLNLVFSFASAYTAPVVLISQNRLAEQDRQKAAINHDVNQLAAQRIELLHAKMDNLLEQNLELRQVVKQQQCSLNALQRRG